MVCGLALFFKLIQFLKNLIENRLVKNCTKIFRRFSYTLYLELTEITTKLSNPEYFIKLGFTSIVQIFGYWN